MVCALRLSEMSGEKDTLLQEILNQENGIVIVARMRV